MDITAGFLSGNPAVLLCGRGEEYASDEEIGEKSTPGEEEI